VHILGFSDGGEVALLIAIHHPDVVRSVLIWGAAGGLDAKASRVLQAIYNLIDDPTEGLHGWNEHLKRRYGERNGRAMTQSWSQASLAILDAGGDISLSRASEIRCPIMILAGERDPFTPTALVQTLAERIPNSELIEAPDAGHTLHEERPEWFTQTALAWLARQSLG
jgi:pimeloyl-ACP methyl ester carboxylesterase